MTTRIPLPAILLPVLASLVMAAPSAAQSGVPRAAEAWAWPTAPAPPLAIRADASPVPYLPHQPRVGPLRADLFLGAVLGAAVGINAGGILGVALVDECDICWQAYVTAAIGNIAGATWGSVFFGGETKGSILGASLGLATGAGLAAFLGGVVNAPNSVNAASFAITQGTLTALFGAP